MRPDPEKYSISKIQITFPVVFLRFFSVKRKTRIIYRSIEIRNNLVYFCFNLCQFAAVNPQHDNIPCLFDLNQCYFNEIHFRTQFSPKKKRIY